jgi:hypothetical protein
MHDVMTDEFINVGLVMHVAGEYKLLSKTRITTDRVKCLFPDLDEGAFISSMRALQRSLKAVADEAFARVSSEPDAASFARRAMPFDDSSLQWSPQGSGLSDDVEKTFDRLYERYVTHYDNRARALEKVVALQPVGVEPSYNFQTVGNALQVFLADAGSATQAQYGFRRTAAWSQYARYQANTQLAEGTNELAQSGVMFFVSEPDLATRQAFSLSIPGQQPQGQTT